MARHEVIALRKIVEPKVTGTVTGTTQRFTGALELPSGCAGILYAFHTKKAARAFWGEDVELVRISEIGEIGRLDDDGQAI